MNVKFISLSFADSSIDMKKKTFALQFAMYGWKIDCIFGSRRQQQQGSMHGKKLLFKTIENGEQRSVENLSRSDSLRGEK
jgi:hypothetical protein